MIYKRLAGSYLLILFATLLSISTFAQDAPDIESGKTLFKNNCASCHNKNMKDKLTGPALGGVQERWSGYPEADLHSWIRNSQALIAAGHPRATELWNEWKPTVMNNFPNLTDAEINNILAYIDCTYKGTCGGGPVVASNEPDPCALPTGLEEKGSSNLVYVFLFAVLALLAVILARIISNLSYMSEMKEKGEAGERKTLAELLTSRGVISFVIFAIIVVGGYFTVHNAINLGRQQGYQPEQPIKFSHIIHACQNQIDCNYCHDGARRSKHSVIPAANTCMNCHKAIKVGSRDGTAELTKIYASIGFDPSTDKYIENYDNMSQEDIKKIYTKWIADTYIADKGSLDADGEALIENQWNGIVKALTNKESGDEKIQGPIEWVRIHNLPDHVYFNHAQHVTVGKVACQTCHGKVEQMDVMKQYAPLSMGWCINCHRKTEVKFADNQYYDNYYEMYHDEIKNNKRDKVTVEDIGGTECQKCHY
ncbi:MAG: c-type cytochrome [Lewinellaceae bacterium]|nr:c-type cytochrome [Saprospiraceae bacterium]MCB9336522.1 c-type cytochrome [Lewinellaceae bacterium]